MTLVTLWGLRDRVLPEAVPAPETARTVRHWLNSPAVLWFERQVVGALDESGARRPARAAVESYVDEHAAVRCPNTCAPACSPNRSLFGAGPGSSIALGRARRDAPVGARSSGWKTSRIDFVRQYVRLLQSLVLFAENELAPSAP